MLNKHSLTLTGWGHLQSVFERNKQFTVVLHLFEPLINSNQRVEMICLNCEVNDESLRHLFRGLREALESGNRVDLHFSVHYTGLSCYFNGLMPDDPLLIVHLKGQLQAIENYHVEKSTLSSSLPFSATPGCKS